jgi:hypothetical protein
MSSAEITQALLHTAWELIPLPRSGTNMNLIQAVLPCRSERSFRFLLQYSTQTGLVIFLGS